MTVVALLVAALAGGSADASSLRRSQAMPAVVGDGTIEGTVTSASTHSAIDGIEVCAYAPEAEPSCTFTNAAGKYAIAIPPGAYVVEFFSPYGSGLNYVTIYQGGASSWEEAEAHPLTVTAGGTDSGVDAAMQEGGHISGHVASAAPPESAIANVEVCAGQVEGEGFGCGLTDASGDYEISALPTGEYLVSFEPPSTGPSFIGQVHEGPVGVTAGATTTGVEARLALGGEIGGKLTAAPSGGPLPGAQACALISETEAVECAPTDEEGDYALRGLPPRSYAVGLAKPGYQWQYYPSGKVFAAAEQIDLLEGTGVGLRTVELLPIGYVPPPPVQPIAPPAPEQKPAPTTAPPTLAGVAGATGRSPAITVSSTRLKAVHGHVPVKVACSNAPCSGTLRITMRVAYRARRHVAVYRTVVLAQGVFSLPADSHATLSLRETAAGRTHLGRAARHPAHAKLLGTVSGGGELSLGVRIA